MAKIKSSFICASCGYKSSKWLGRCPQCGEWNSFIEEVEETESRPLTIGDAKEAHLLSDISFKDSDRFFSGMAEFDRVLGGLVAGQAVLISGEPGVGKSTLLLQLAHKFAKKKKVYYVNGEESGPQIKSRSERLGLSGANVFLVPENRLEALVQRINSDKPDVVIVDSIQTLSSSRFTSLPGSIVQARECAYELVGVAKKLNMPIFIVSHITKGGQIAGPKVVEHMVDTVLFLESDRQGFYRVLRALKNRFFSCDEMGLFEMKAKGLTGIKNISSAFLHPHETQVSGVSVFPFIEGSRVFPVEVQALSTPSRFNYPKRTSDGMENNRLLMLLAIMEKRLGLDFSTQDVYVNITGGIHINDPALDLAVAAALVSSLKDRPISLKTAFFGELGLAAEIRPVRSFEKRIRELSRLGFTALFLPKNKNIPSDSSVKLYPSGNLKEVFALL